jgi:hypothetical protein
MLFPKDRPVYTNLGTSFTNFDALLVDLNGGRVTGCVTVTFSNFSAVVFINHGSVVNAAVESVRGRCTGDAAAQELAATVASRGGRIDVYALTPELVMLMAGLADSEVVYRDLSTEFASPERLITKLGDDGHTGYVEVTLERAQGEGVVFFRDGRVIEAVLASEGKTYAGARVVDSVVQAAANLGAKFNVYRAGSAAAAPAQAPAAPPPVMMDERAGGPVPVAPEAIPFVRRDAPAQPIPAAIDQDELLAFWSELLSRAERTVDALSAPGRFAAALREVLVEKAAVYPYLDPFAAEFSYRDGQAEFDGEVPSTLSDALGDCMQDTIARLAFRLKRSDLETRVRAELSDLYDAHHGMIDRFSLQTQALVS